MKNPKRLKYLIYKALVFMLWLALATGCRRETALVPTEIHYGIDTCAECGMIINDQHYSAVLAWRDSDGSIQTAAFDDVGCLLAWRQHHAGKQIAAMWVKNVRTGAWLDASSAIYVKSPHLQTPMGGGIAAGATTNDFAALPIEKSVLAWTNILSAQNGQTDRASPGDNGKN